MKECAVHALVLALLFVVGWAVLGWPLMGLSLFIFGSNAEIAAVAAFLTYLAGFSAIYYGYLQRSKFAPWRNEER